MKNIVRRGFLFMSCLLIVQVADSQNYTLSPENVWPLLHGSVSIQDPAAFILVESLSSTSNEIVILENNQPVQFSLYAPQRDELAGLQVNLFYSLDYRQYGSSILNGLDLLYAKYPLSISDNELAGANLFNYIDVPAQFWVNMIPSYHADYVFFTVSKTLESDFKDLILPATFFGGLSLCHTEVLIKKMNAWVNQQKYGDSVFFDITSKEQPPGKKHYQIFKKDSDGRSLILEFDYEWIVVDPLVEIKSSIDSLYNAGQFIEGAYFCLNSYWDHPEEKTFEWVCSFLEAALRNLSRNTYPQVYELFQQIMEIDQAGCYLDIQVQYENFLQEAGTLFDAEDYSPKVKYLGELKEIRPLETTEMLNYLVARGESAYAANRLRESFDYFNQAYSIRSDSRIESRRMAVSEKLLGELYESEMFRDLFFLISKNEFLLSSPYVSAVFARVNYELGKYGVCIEQMEKLLNNWPEAAPFSREEAMEVLVSSYQSSFKIEQANTILKKSFIENPQSVYLLVRYISNNRIKYLEPLIKILKTAQPVVDSLNRSVDLNIPANMELYYVKTIGFIYPDSLPSYSVHGDPLSESDREVIRKMKQFFQTVRHEDDFSYTLLLDDSGIGIYLKLSHYVDPSRFNINELVKLPKKQEYWDKLKRMDYQETMKYNLFAASGLVNSVGSYDYLTNFSCDPYLLSIEVYQWGQGCLTLSGNSIETLDKRTIKYRAYAEHDLVIDQKSVKRMFFPIFYGVGQNNGFYTLNLNVLNQ